VSLRGRLGSLGLPPLGGGKPIWGALADELDTPKRRKVAVNLSRIRRHSGEEDGVALQFLGRKVIERSYTSTDGCTD